MAAADYRLLTEATGQRIATALEALSGTGAAAAAARTNMDVYSKSETDSAIAQSTALINEKIPSKYSSSETVNLNDLDNGICSYTNASNNIPSSGHGGTVITLRNNYDSQGLQISQVNSMAGFYYRNIINNTWSAWKNLQ